MEIAVEEKPECDKFMIASIALGVCLLLALMVIKSLVDEKAECNAGLQSSKGFLETCTSKLADCLSVSKVPPMFVASYLDYKDPNAFNLGVDPKAMPLSQGRRQFLISALSKGLNIPEAQFAACTDGTLMQLLVKSGYTYDMLAAGLKQTGRDFETILAQPPSSGIEVFKQTFASTFKIPDDAVARFTPRELAIMWQSSGNF